MVSGRTFFCCAFFDSSSSSISSCAILSASSVCVSRLCASTIRPCRIDSASCSTIRCFSASRSSPGVLGAVHSSSVARASCIARTAASGCAASSGASTMFCSGSGAVVRYGATGALEQGRVASELPAHLVDASDPLRDALLPARQIGQLVEQHLPDGAHPHLPLELLQREVGDVVALADAEPAPPLDQLGRVLLREGLPLLRRRQPRRRRRAVGREALGDHRRHVRVERAVLAALEVQCVDVRALGLPRLEQGHLGARFAALGRLVGLVPLEVARVRLH